MNFILNFSLKLARPAAGLALALFVTPLRSAGEPATPRRVDINEYRVEGAFTLPAVEVERAVYPFLGPLRTPADVEGARVALEKAYRDKGYQAVSVEIPPQQVRDGIVLLQVREAVVGRLRVHGARYSSLDEIKAAAPSLAEGRTPDFNAVQKDIVALNQQPDRQVTPAIRAGVEPGTLDVDLNVKESLPLHGNLELNNRYSANTTALRLSGSFRYENLWQLGHSAGVSVQIAPENLDDSKVFSGYYLARPVGADWLGLLVQAVKQDSDVNTLGNMDVAGRGEVIGLRGLITLPAGAAFYHSLSLGVDYKHFDEDLRAGAVSASKTPITYYPFSSTYTATWLGQGGSSTQLSAGVTFSLRGLGSDPEEFDNKRLHADGSFIYFRGDLSRTQALPGDFQLYGQVQGQASSQPLVSNEQFSGGGLGTARGYLESEVAGDNALFATVEFRGPSLTLGKLLDEWRLYVFAEGGGLTLNQPAKEQDSRFTLASVGAGSRVKFQEHFNGSLDLGVPLITRSPTKAGDLRLTFRLWGEF